MMRNERQENGRNKEARGVYLNPRVQFPPEAKPGREKVKEIMGILSQNGLNFILPLMNTQGQIYYHGNLGKRYTDEWDPLEEMVREAHRDGMRVHSWFCVFEEGGEKARENPDLVLTNRDDSLRNALDPGNPRARKYMIELIMAVVKNYDIDGINLDYLRYPTNDTVCYCAHCRGEFKDRFGVDLANLGDNDPMLARWDRYREEQLFPACQLSMLLIPTPWPGEQESGLREGIGILK